MVSEMGGNTEKQDKKKKILRSLPARLHTALLAGWLQVSDLDLGSGTRDPLKLPDQAPKNSIQCPNI